MRADKVPVAREGYPFILFAAWSSLLSALLQCESATLFFFIVTAFITWFFRDPCRIVPDDDHAFVSPADGKVILVDSVVDRRFFDQEVTRISIFMNVFNVHVNRIPYPGVVQRILFKPGRFYSADKEQALLHNEYCCLLLESDSGYCYGVVQVAGLVARRIVCRAEAGDRLQRGQRYGLIRFGSRVDLYLTRDVEVVARIGQKVKAGETILARRQQS